MVSHGVVYYQRNTLIDVDSKLLVDDGFGTGINIAKLMMVPIEGAPFFVDCSYPYAN